MDLALAGINFRTAPIELRERLSFTAAELPRALERLQESLPEAERVLLSTCNRTELYTAGGNAAGMRDAVIRALAEAGGPMDLEQGTHFYFKSGTDAAAHLFAVSASLDSMVVGETEILGQVKQAYLAALEVGSCGKMLNPLFQQALNVAKQVHTETGISRGRASVSSLAVEFAEKIFDELTAKNILVVGSGETAELALKSLVARPVREVFILNRSLERARELAGTYEGEAAPLDQLESYLPRADIVISSTSATHCVIPADKVAAAAQQRRGRPMLLIDIAVPRDIEPGAADIKNVYLYHIDDLQRLAEENLSRRRDAIGQARAIVDAEVHKLEDCFRAPDMGRLMQAVDARAKAVRESSLAWALSKQHLADLPEPAREQVEALAARITGQLLAAPKAALRQAARNGNWEAYASMVRELFDLKDTEGGGSATEEGGEE